MPELPDPRAVTAAVARQLLEALGGPGRPPVLRVVEVLGRAACLVLVWDTGADMPTAAADRRAGGVGERETCKAAVLAALAAAAGPLTTKDLQRLLKDGRPRHGPGTVVKALADLTRAGLLVNPKDKRGYRLPEWQRREPTPSLF